MITYIFVTLLLLSSRVVFGSFVKLSMVHIFVVSYSILILVGLPLIKVPSDQYAIYFWSANLVPFLVILGAAFGKFFRVKGTINAYGFHFMELFLVRNGFWLLIAFLIFLSFYAFDIGFNNSAIIYSLLNPGSAIDSMELRLHALDSNFSPLLSRLYGYTRSIFVLFFCSFFTVEYCKGKISRSLYFSIIFFSVFYCAYSAAKAPIFYLLLAVGLSFYWYRRSVVKDQGKLWKIYMRLLVIIFLGFTVSSALYPILHGYSGIDAVIYAFDNLVNRVFIVPTRAAFYYFEVFGVVYEKPGLKSIGLVAYLTDQDSINPAALLYSYYYDNQFYGRGLINAAFFASVYGSFGLVVMSLSCFFLGFILGALESFFSIISSDAIRFALKSVCALAVAQLPMADLLSTFSGRGLILMPLVLFFASLFFVTIRNRRLST